MTPHTPAVDGWTVIPSPTDAEMSAVQGVYLVADKLPLEDAQLIAASPALLKALTWALPLATIAMEDHRTKRIQAGHSDINGTYKNGVTWAGIYQSEVDEIEAARAALAKARGQ